MISRIFHFHAVQFSLGRIFHGWFVMRDEHCGSNDSCSRLSLDCWTIGPLDHWTIGPVCFDISQKELDRTNEINKNLKKKVKQRKMTFFPRDFFLYQVPFFPESSKMIEITFCHLVYNVRLKRNGVGGDKMNKGEEAASCVCGICVYYKISCHLRQKCVKLSNGKLQR